MSEPMLRILSLGAGVQSSTVALMAARGDIESPDYAIFADTGDEPKKVYEWLDWLETQLPFSVIRAKRKGPSLSEHAILIATSDVTRTASPPWYTKADGPISRERVDDETGETWTQSLNPNGMLPRQCSQEYKVRVITAEVRKILGVNSGERVAVGTLVEQWIGISMDEIQRMKDAPNKWQRNRWPLIERRMSRRDCLKWMAERQYPTPPKSSCIYCPYRGDAQWRDMRDNHPEDWARACEIDHAIRPGFFGMQGEAFVHRQRVPLSQVDLSTDADRGQIEFGFLQECEGICGT